MPTKSHPIYSKDCSVFLETGRDKFDALGRAMDVAHFLDNVETVFTQSGKARDAFLIAIKPNIMTASVREDLSPVYTDPQLVEYLVGRLRERGFRDIAVVEAPIKAATWLPWRTWLAIRGMAIASKTSRNRKSLLITAACLEHIR